MRLKETELLERYPSFNYYVDPVATWYGDKPAEYRNLKWYNETVNLAGDDDTMCNLFAVDWYVYKAIGEHKLYKVLTGNVGIRTDVDGTDEVMYGDLAVKCGTCTYNIYYNNIYGWNSLTILHNGQVCTGWRNERGQSSPSRRVKKLDDDTIQKIFKSKHLDDYGYAVKKFIERIKEVYESNKENHWLEIKE